MAPYFPDVPAAAAANTGRVASSALPRHRGRSVGMVAAAAAAALAIRWRRRAVARAEADAAT